MKRKYIKPEIEEIEVEMDSLLTFQSGETSGSMVGDGEYNEEWMEECAKIHNSAWDEWD